MGCDIHIVVERRKSKSAKWVGLYATNYHPAARIPIAQRDYAFFTEIAAVRGRTTTSRYPQNVPEDISELAWIEYMAAPTDHHSASHMSLVEFCAIWLRVHPNAQGVRPEYPAHDLFGVYPDDDEEYDYRVVFWFDN